MQNFTVFAFKKEEKICQKVLEGVSRTQCVRRASHSPLSVCVGHLSKNFFGEKKNIYKKISKKTSNGNDSEKPEKLERKEIRRKVWRNVPEKWVFQFLFDFQISIVTKFWRYK